MTFEIAEVTARSQFFDKTIKQLASQTYKFKSVVAVMSTSSWKNYFYRETTTPLAGKTGNTIKGIPRGAAFPQASVSWERILKVQEKYGLEENIPWEDLISDEIAVRERTSFRIAEGVVKAVDDEIYSSLSTDTGIQTITITDGFQWNAASAAIMDNLMEAVEKMEDYFYDTSNATCLINGRDYRSMMDYIYEKGAQAPKLGETVLSSGKAMQVAGITFIKSQSVPASEALIVVPKRCATWRELVPLKTITKEDPFKSLTVRSVEMGVTEVTDPKAIVRIVNTDDAS